MQHMAGSSYISQKPLFFFLELGTICGSVFIWMTMSLKSSFHRLTAPGGKNCFPIAFLVLTLVHGKLAISICEMNE